MFMTKGIIVIKWCLG